MKRWSVQLIACDGRSCGEFSRHRTLFMAERRARIESAADVRLRQLVGSRWVVVDLRDSQPFAARASDGDGGGL